MPKESNFENIKKLRELTGAGFKDCNNAIKESKGDIAKSIEYLRVKGITKASKKMKRSAKEGLICITNSNDASSIIEINSETDFVAKNEEYIKFCEELSKINFSKKGNINELKKTKMSNEITVEENLVNLISKMGEKITISRNDYIHHEKSYNFSYVHNSLKNNVGKLGVVVSLQSNELNDRISDFGKKLAMHIAASNPLAIDEKNIDSELLNKEKKMINDELKNSGKPENIIKKISIGRLEKFKQENTLLNQYWVIDPKKKVKEILEDFKSGIIIKGFVRYKIGE